MKFYPLLFTFCSTVLLALEPTTNPKELRKEETDFPLFQYTDQPSTPPGFKPSTPTERVYLFGDWNGERSKLAEQGFAFDLTYVSDIQGNPVGGKNRGFAQAGSMGLDLKLDLEKLVDAKGLEFFTSFVWRNGTNLSSRKIGNKFAVAQVFGGESYRLNELYLKQKLCDGNLHLKAGRLDVGNDFLQSPLNYYFVSNAFDGNPVSVFFNSGFTAYPNATWGAYMDFTIMKRFKAQFGVYNMNPSIFKNKYHGANFTFHNTEGILLITQMNYLLNQAPEDKGLRGDYRLGYFCQTGNKVEFSGPMHKDNYSIYFSVDQCVYHKGDGLVTPFANFIFAPRNRNLFPYFFDCGVACDGIIKGRPDDAIAFGAAYGSYSSDLRRVQRQARSKGLLRLFGNRPQDFELVLELNYWWQITKWIVVTPDIQYIIHPKGYSNIKNALVIGAQVGVTF